MGIARLDGLILTHDDTDHTGGALSVMQAMPISWISSSLPEVHPILRQEANKQRCEDGQTWQWDGAYFEMLQPDAASYNKANIRDNDRGCVLRISIGEQHVLLTADIEKNSERQLLREHKDKLPATMLVVPHHGSKTSSTEEFISAVRPTYAVFTSGYRNRFGHPKQEIMLRYLDTGAQLLRSDEDGAILIEMNADGIQVERYRKSHRRYWTHPSPNQVPAQ
jgi:competence protein ComEC